MFTKISTVYLFVGVCMCGGCRGVCVGCFVCFSFLFFSFLFFSFLFFSFLFFSFLFFSFLFFSFLFFSFLFFSFRFVSFRFVLFCFALFCFVFFLNSRRQIWVGHSFVQYEIWNMIFGWTRYKTEHRVVEVLCSKCLIVSVISFHVYFDKQVHKNEKNKQAQKLKAWILLNQTRTEKQMHAAALSHIIFFSLIDFALQIPTFIFYLCSKTRLARWLRNRPSLSIARK